MNFIFENKFLFHLEEPKIRSLNKTGNLIILNFCLPLKNKKLVIHIVKKVYDRTKTSTGYKNIKQQRINKTQHCAWHD